MKYSKIKKLSQRTTAAFVFSPVFIAASGAWAQSGGEREVLEEVIVTASYRSVSVQDLSMAVTALTSKTLEEMGATDIQDYYRTVPNFSVIDRGPGQRLYTMRGVSTGLVTQSAATVGVYIDEIPVSAAGFQPDIKVFDLDRVEVLRGPQGTLYGAGSMGGTVRMITPDPDPAGFFGKAEVSGSTTEHGGGNDSVAAMVNIPLSKETLALRASAYQYNWSGFIDRVAQPDGLQLDAGAILGAPPGVLPVLDSGPVAARSNINDEKTYGGRVGLLWSATQDLSFELNYLGQRGEFGGRPVESNNSGDYKTDFYIGETLADDLDLYNLTIKYDLGWANFTSASSYWDRSVARQGDNADLGNAIVPGAKLTGVATYTDDYQDEKVHEMRLTSNSDGSLTWILGFFYQDKDNGYQQYMIDELDFFVDFVNILGIPATNERQLLDHNGRFKERQTAVYGELNYEFTERWSALFGLRYFDYKQTTTITNNDINILGLGLQDGRYEGDDNGTTPKFTLRFAASDDMMFYATAAKGYRIGGVNTAPRVPDEAIVYEPDSLWSYELGSKISSSEGRLTLNSVVYYVDWSDIQLALPLGFSFATVNAGEADVTGVEFELAWQATERLRLSGSLGYNDGQLSEDVPEANNPDNPNPGFKGDTLPGVADTTASVSSQYTGPLGTTGMEWHVRADYQYTGDSQTTFNEMSTANGQSSHFKLDAYGLLSLRLGVKNERWGATLYADNILDKRAVILQDNAAVATRTTINRPYTVGVRLSLNF